LRQDRFEKAKEIGIFPENAPFNSTLPGFREWNDLNKDDKASYTSDMAMMAGMLEAMDYHLGRYVKYLNQKGLMENTIFIITSDNGPDGAEYIQSMPWAYTAGGYHRNLEKKGGQNYFGYLGAEAANAMASPFSFFKYYTGEGGLRVPLIITGKNLPEGAQTDAFCFFTDIAPTIYDFAGLPTTGKKGYEPVTGKSMLPHIQNFNQSIYGRDEGVGLEAANSSAYFLDGYKIVRNNIPLGDNQWYLYNLANDPGETHDLKSEEPELFQNLLVKYNRYAETVGVLEMPEGYYAAGEIKRKSYIQIAKSLLPYFIVLTLGIAGFIMWRRRRRNEKLRL